MAWEPLMLTENGTWKAQLLSRVGRRRFESNRNWNILGLCYALLCPPKSCFGKLTPQLWGQEVEPNGRHWGPGCPSPTNGLMPLPQSELLIKRCPSPSV
jgi:hypothetical protein